jgi:hypothetical protein
VSRPVALLLTLAVAATAVAGCGGDKGAGSPADAVRAYNAAIADGDGKRACAQLDASAQKELQNSTQGAIRNSCKQVIDLLAQFYDDATKQRLRDAKVEAETVGDHATARFLSPVGFGAPDREQSYELRRVGSGWKIASLGLHGD